MTDDEYGPNTVAVQAVIDRIGTLTEAESDSLTEAWPEMGYAEWYAGWNPALTAVTEAARGEAWYAAHGVTWSAACEASAVTAVALETALNVVLAELVRDLITPEQYETLTGQWYSVVGREETGDV